MIIANSARSAELATTISNATRTRVIIVKYSKDWGFLWIVAPQDLIHRKKKVRIIASHLTIVGLGVKGSWKVLSGTISVNTPTVQGTCSRIGTYGEWRLVRQEFAGWGGTHRPIINALPEICPIVFFFLTKLGIIISYTWDFQYARLQSSKENKIENKAYAITHWGKMETVFECMHVSNNSSKPRKSIFGNLFNYL